VKFGFKPIYLSVMLLAAGYAYSVYHYVQVRAELAGRDSEERDERVVVVTHWQLEPGFEAAMQWAIDTYNALPRVQEAGVRVRQLPITEKVYNQFMNTQLIAGTAPDIAQKGKTQLVEGEAVAKFYTPLSEYVSKPNPYNQPDLLPDDLSKGEKLFMAEAAWKDTFIDSMAGGFDNELQDYYAVPVSSFGQQRTYYNLDILRKVKSWLKPKVEQPVQPDWLAQIWRRMDDDGTQSGYLPDTPELRAWLSTDEPPQTLGQLILFAEAVERYADETGQDDLVAIAGSNYEAGDITIPYEKAFFRGYAPKIDYDRNATVTPLETYAGWEEGKWSFNDPPVREYFELSRTLAEYFPSGFLGLDREQAQRRFVLGNAAAISSGLWDYQAIADAVQAKENPADRFEIAIARSPAAAPGERWHEYAGTLSSEASTTTGVPLAINKMSPNFDWALDFLHFLTGVKVNEELNRRAGWLPSVLAADPTEMLTAFVPQVEGTAESGNLRFNNPIKTTYTGQRKLFLTGDITYDEFVSRMQDVLSHPRHGTRRMWFTTFEDSRSGSRARDRAIVVESIRGLSRGEEDHQDRIQSLMLQSISGDEGVEVEQLWNSLHPDEPFPTP